ncbi:MAG: hypothetical protein ABSB19_00765 [Methylomonas sp.]|jgi:hypothetical protein
MNEILQIEQAYHHAGARVKNIPALIKALKQWHADYPDYNFLHPCVIESRAALVYRHRLSSLAPKAFAELASIAIRHELYLKEDARILPFSPRKFERRAKKLMVLSYCVSLLTFARSASSDESATQTQLAAYSTPSYPSMQASIKISADGQQIFSLHRALLPGAPLVHAAYTKLKESKPANPRAAEKIRNYLLQAYRPEDGDPSYIASDIAEIAGYYAGYPEVVSLFEQLQDKKLSLKFKADNWQTQAWGNASAVHSVTIYFDTRVGAVKLLEDANCAANPACSIMPADALLHEFLHAKLMMLDSQHFIAEGGMMETLYPFEHEREVIDNENRLYSEMNRADGFFRPIRHRHIGNLVHVGCAVCLPGILLAQQSINQSGAF